MGKSIIAAQANAIRLVVLPALRPALVGSLLLTLAVVIGEFTFANVLLFRTYAVFINEIGQHEATEAAALSVVSFLITWAAMLEVLFVGRGQAPLTDAKQEKGQDAHRASTQRAKEL